jgi:dephospho-CoA kinase
VAARLAARGAVIIDADLIARQVVEPGWPAYKAIAERFGPGILTPAGDLDRPALAALVFVDEVARKDLEGITHPAIQAEMAAQLLAAPPEAVVILDIPLLKAKQPHMAGVIVVDVPEEVALDRLVGQRGFSEKDARRRITAQISRDERRAIADLLIDNSGGLAVLDQEVERAWAWIKTLEPGPAAPPPPR